MSPIKPVEDLISIMVTETIQFADDNLHSAIESEVYTHFGEDKKGLVGSRSDDRNYFYAKLTNPIEAQSTIDFPSNWYIFNKFSTNKTSDFSHCILSRSSDPHNLFQVLTTSCSEFKNSNFLLFIFNNSDQSFGIFPFSFEEHIELGKFTKSLTNRNTTYKSAA
jgi:hypothetical protein